MTALCGTPAIVNVLATSCLRSWNLRLEMLRFSVSRWKASERALPVSGGKTLA